MQAKVYFSQFGEDVVAARLLRNIESGFYVDVGAFHPVRKSNTALFHLLGWTGVNVEPTRANFVAFEEFRPFAINRRAAIHNTLTEVELHVFRAGQLNTIDSDLSTDRQNRGDDYRGSETVPALSLNQLFGELEQDGTHVNYFTIDVEGYDFEALSRFDFDRFRPDVICAEVGFSDPDLLGLADDPTVQLLRDHHYSPRAVTGLSVTFMRTELGRIAPSMADR